VRYLNDPAKPMLDQIEEAHEPQARDVGIMIDAGTILVVDDELESLQLLTHILLAQGYQVHPADTSELALEYLREKLPELVLLDLRMPGLDGLEVCRRIKAKSDTRHIPLMFISASDEPEERIEALKLGALDFISKPFRREELLARVRTHLELGRLRAGLEKRVAERTAELMIANRQLELDLIDRRLAEQALRETEERFRNMADTAPVMIWVSDRDKRCTFFNKVWLDFTAHSMEEELRGGWAASVHPEDLHGYYETYSSSFDAHRRFQMEHRLRRSDGEYRWVLNTGVPRFEAGGTCAGYIGSCIDTTDLKLNQERMLATQKLESLGVLSAGIAHDFNNMLSSIFAEADLAFADLPSDSPGRENLNRICAVSIRASEILNLLMAYAGGKGDEAFEAVDLSSLIQEMLELLKVSISKKATLKTSLITDCPPVHGNPTQIRRVLMNLVTNASEALGGNQGSIRMTTTVVRIRPESSEGATTSLSEGGYVILEVSDSGCGMSEQALARAFDPFYTTKSLGRGLGLSAVQGIIRSHGGAIDVVSAPGRGSTFRVFLPCDHEPGPKKSIPPITEEETTLRSQTIFLVEDEETLRLAVSMALRKNGFSVLTADDGRAALNLFQERADNIDAILLDLTLPELSGVEVLYEMRRLRPNARVILTSAYDREMVSGHFGSGEQAVCAFIRKPYRIRELVRVLQGVLSQAEAGV
jgi:two-component system, cell cycle sensor histidine kinase and response regulator CckA